MTRDARAAHHEHLWECRFAPEKGGDWLRMQCLPTARGLLFKQDAVFGMSARCSSLGQNTPLYVVKEGRRDR
jgi:hypothetical protein